MRRLWFFASATGLLVCAAILGVLTLIFGLLTGLAVLTDTGSGGPMPSTGSGFVSCLLTLAFGAGTLRCWEHVEHLQQRRPRCGVCLKRFDSQGDLDVHALAKHGETPAEAITREDRERRKRVAETERVEAVFDQRRCPECDREFGDAQAARQHHHDKHVATAQGARNPRSRDLRAGAPTAASSAPERR